MLSLLFRLGSDYDEICQDSDACTPHTYCKIQGRQARTCQHLNENECDILGGSRSHLYICSASSWQKPIDTMCKAYISDERPVAFIPKSWNDQCPGKQPLY